MTLQLVSVTALRVVDVIRDDEHGIEDKVRLVATGSEQNDGRSGKMPKLGRPVLGELKAAV